MRIILASPLYPPDIAEPALYIKELAKRLAKHHETVVVTYGQLPEQAASAHIIAIDKRRPLPWRLVRYTAALWRAVRDADALYIQNGASVELPALVATVLTHKPFVMHIGDERAHERAQQRMLYGLLERVLVRRAAAVVRESPPARPEILPFKERPATELAAWDEEWKVHCAWLTELFESIKKHESI